MEKLKEISCDPSCGFMVRSYNEKEVIELAKQHMKKAHPEMKVSEKDLKSKVKIVKIK